MALNGVTVLYRGFHLSMVGVNEAHGHQIPFSLVNTCVHELLHVFLFDISLGAQSSMRRVVEGVSD